MRRLAEAFVALIALVLLAPVLVAIGIVVRLDTPGPALFRQLRVGHGGREFEIWKFRTMTQPESSDEDHGQEVTVAGDVRVTRVGRLLRRRKLDELPQLVNVVRGEMALVGPRPEVPRYVALWPARLREVILSIPPGLTDPTSIALRDEEGLLGRQPEPERYYREVLLPRKAAMYAAYVRTRCLRGDAKILARTVKAALWV
ncbi:MULTISPECIES: sugar transferase [Mumia]|uniref:sugar transferase n=1 Tax=Mumia TaxID=1546255 RepID=UPI00141F058E|nr:MULTISPECIES: sugar transferase [unclassified Mumia]QMW66880.1 sugar transferase [Mumia sp. ZJ1417]